MENGVANIARMLEPRGVDTYVACLVRRGAFADRLPVPGRVVAMGKTAGFSIGAAWRLGRHLAAVRPHVVHTHNLGPLIYTSLASGFGRRWPILHGEHSQLTDEERSPRRLRQRRWLYRACRAVHTVSAGIRDELLSLGFAGERIHVLANGVDTARFVPGNLVTARHAFGLPSDAQVLGIVGRFGAYKRHDILMDAFEQIASELPNVHLLVVGGGGPEESRVRAHADASPCAARIHFTGFQPDPVAAYQAFDLLALPSINEGLSNAALEAMACGVPVLANTGCGHEQIITDGHDGIIADLHTAPALATQLSAALRHPARLVDFGQNARTKVAAHFSLLAMIDAYEQLYRNCARP